MARDDQDISTMLIELDRCMVPASPEEHALLDELLSLNFYEVMRAPTREMADMQMRPQQCHNNAMLWASLDPSGNSKPVSGWWRRGDLFLFHSVVLSQSVLHCVTPHDFPAPIEFAPDADIHWQEIGAKMVADRRGMKVPYLVRGHPEETIASARTARLALLAGD
ncbi:MAG: hypothetical protein ACSLE1_20615 [Sphingobium sp.]